MTTDSGTGAAARGLAFSDLSFEEYVAAVAVMVIVGAITWGVATRYVTETPAAWTTEVAAIAFSWAVFVGAAGAFKRCEHITFDMHTASWPALVRRIVQVACDATVLVTLATLAVFSISFTRSTWDVPTTVMRLPQGITYAGAAVGFTLMTLRHAAVVVARVRSKGSAA